MIKSEPPFFANLYWRETAQMVAICTAQVALGQPDDWLALSLIFDKSLNRGETLKPEDEAAANHVLNYVASVAAPFLGRLPGDIHRQLFVTRVTVLVVDAMAVAATSQQVEEKFKEDS